MIIAVPFAGPGVSRAIASVMIESCRRAMPHVEVWQLTDEATEQLPGTSGVIRHKLDRWSDFYFGHMIALEGEVLRLDYDVVVQRDVSEIFSYPFDLALTRRPLNDPTCSNSIRIRNPHNHGVMFLRNSRSFFELALEEYRKYEDSGWMDVAIALEQAAAETKLRWVELPGERYNYTPKNRNEDVSDCSIVHYKGNRKWWMVGAENEEEAKRDGTHVLDMLKYAT